MRFKLLIRLCQVAAISAILAFAGGGRICLSTAQAGAAQFAEAEFVQITSMRLNDGIQWFEAFRIHRNNKVEWARWNSLGRLTGYSPSCVMCPATFSKIISSPCLSNPAKPTDKTTTLGRWAFRLEIGAFSQSTVDMVVMTRIPDDIGVIIDEIRTGVDPIAIQPGRYLWTKPYPMTGTADIDLTVHRADSPVARTLLDSLATGRMILPVNQAAESSFWSGHGRRLEYVARLKAGDMRFGVLFVK